MYGRVGSPAGAPHPASRSVARRPHRAAPRLAATTEDDESSMPSDHNLGDFVVLPQRPDWGIGQVQSVIGERVTVNFEHAGKQVINTGRASLLPASDAGPNPGALKGR